MPGQDFPDHLRLPEFNEEVAEQLRQSDQK